MRLILEKRDVRYVFLCLFLLLAVVTSAVRFPVPRSDADSWGSILNQFLNVTLDQNGTVRNITFGVNNETIDNDVDGWVRIKGSLNGTQSIAFGRNTKATGSFSVAIGDGSNATGNNATAIGYYNTASGASSAAIGYINDASGFGAIAIGALNRATGLASFAAGSQSLSSGGGSIAIGDLVTAVDDGAFAGGQSSTASASSSVALGNTARASDSSSVALGNAPNATGISAISIGESTKSSGRASVALGYHTEASGDYSTVLGFGGFASSEAAFAVGTGSQASGKNSTALGSATIASGATSFAIGHNTTASGFFSVAMGKHINVSGTNSIGFGISNQSAVLAQDDTFAVVGGYVGINTTSPNRNMALDVSGAVEIDLPGVGKTNALCHTDNTTTNQEIVDCTGTPSADYAELYAVAEGIEVGDLVVPSNRLVTTNDEDLVSQLVKTTAPYQRNIIGVVSDPSKSTDFNVIGYNIKEEDNPMPVALNGRVKIKISLENGPIMVGDVLTSSSIPGIAMKATQPGMVIAVALEPFDSDVMNQEKIGTIMAFINREYYPGTGMGIEIKRTFDNHYMMIAQLAKKTQLMEKENRLLKQKIESHETRITALEKKR